MQTEDGLDRADLSASAAGETQTSRSLVDRYLPMVYSVIAKHRLDDEQDAGHLNPAAWLHLVPITAFGAIQLDARPTGESALRAERHPA